MQRVHFEGAGSRAINRMNATGLQVASLQYTDYWHYITMHCIPIHFERAVQSIQWRQCNQANECNGVETSYLLCLEWHIALHSIAIQCTVFQCNGVHFGGAVQSIQWMQWGWKLQKSGMYRHCNALYSNALWGSCAINPIGVEACNLQCLEWHCIALCSNVFQCILRELAAAQSIRWIAGTPPNMSTLQCLEVFEQSNMSTLTPTLQGFSM